jgi:FtsH-binding integral membrane protein
VKKRGLELAMVDIFSNLNSFLLAFFSVCFAVVYLGFESHRDRAFLMRDLGIPTGLIGSLIGMVQAITVLVDPGATSTTKLWGASISERPSEVIYSATAVMLLTTLYGSVISAIGYFYCSSGRPEPSKIINRRRLLMGKWATSIALIGIWLYAMFSSVRGVSFYEPFTLFIFLGSAGVALLKSKPGYYLANISQAFITSAMISVTCGVIILFGGQTMLGLSIAGVGLTWGLMGHVITYVVSYSSEKGLLTRAPLTNWHWIEVTGFYIFMFLAPDTVLDNFQDAAIETRFNALEGQVMELQEALEHERSR